MPKELFCLKALTTLAVPDNRIGPSLPEELGASPSLTHLNLSSNRFAYRPSKSCSLRKRLARLVRLPFGIGRLTALTELDVSKNKLTRLPSGVANLVALKVLELSKNPLSKEMLVGFNGGKKMSKKGTCQIQPTLEYFESVRHDVETPAVRLLQTRIRAWLSRRRFLRVIHIALAVHRQQQLMEEYQQELIEHESACVIQRFFKFQKARRRWRELVRSARANEPISAPKIHHEARTEFLLVQSDNEEELFQDEDQHETNIIYDNALEQDDVGPRLPRILGATLEKLIVKATDEYSSDMAFISTLLLTYRTYATPAQLLHRLVARYEEVKRSPPLPLPYSHDVCSREPTLLELTNVLEELDQEFTNDSTTLSKLSRRERIRRGVLALIRHWVERCPYDFVPKAMSKVLQDFLARQEREAIDSVWRKEAVDLQDYFEQRMFEFSAVEFDFARAAAAGPPTMMPSVLTVGSVTQVCVDPLASSKFGLMSDQVESKELARQLSLLDHCFLTRIEAKEYMQQAWVKKGKERRAPNLLAAVSFFNHVSNMVSSIVVAAASAEDRGSLITYFIQVAGYCRDLNNFNGVMEGTVRICREGARLLILQDERSYFSAALGGNISAQKKLDTCRREARATLRGSL